MDASALIDQRKALLDKREQMIQQINAIAQKREELVALVHRCEGAIEMLNSLIPPEPAHDISG